MHMSETHELNIVCVRVCVCDYLRKNYCCLVFTVHWECVRDVKINAMTLRSS